MKKYGKQVLAKAKSKIKSIPKIAGKKAAQLVVKLKTSKTAKKLVVSHITHLIRLEKARKAICSGTAALSTGFVDGIAGNASFGVVETLNKNKEVYGDNNLYYIGKLLSDVGSLAVGGLGIVGGGALAGVGVGLDVTGVGTVVGVPANIAGVALASGSAAVATSGGTNFVRDAKDLFSNIKESGASRYDLKKVKNNKEANKLAKEFGYEGAEDLKESYVGKGAISKFNMKYDSKTGEIVLESIKDTSIQVPTGLYKK
ncbi:hypothetical protein HB815_06430 [Listeria booriae]|nr:hypothetical protein [Listeria booriae]